MEIEYDSGQRIKYHPDIHTRHGEPYSIQEYAYICQSYENMKVRDLAFTIGRTEASLRSLVTKIRKESLFDKYKKMDCSKFERELGEME